MKPKLYEFIERRNFIAQQLEEYSLKAQNNIKKSSISNAKYQRQYYSFIKQVLDSGSQKSSDINVIKFLKNFSHLDALKHFSSPELLKEFKALEALLKTHAIRYDVKKDDSIRLAMNLLRKMIKNSSVNIVGLLYEFNKYSVKHNSRVKVKKNRK